MVVVLYSGMKEKQTNREVGRQRADQRAIVSMITMTQIVLWIEPRTITPTSHPTGHCCNELGTPLPPSSPFATLTNSDVGEKEKKRTAQSIKVTNKPREEGKATSGKRKTNEPSLVLGKLTSGADFVGLDMDRQREKRVRSFFLFIHSPKRQRKKRRRSSIWRY